MADWLPMETAPKSDKPFDRQRVLLLVRYRAVDRKMVRIGAWDPDLHSKRPRPYWAVETFNATDSRNSIILGWMPLPSVEQGRSG